MPMTTLLQGHLHPDADGFLADIEMAKTANQPHAIKLARLFLEPANEQHVAIVFEQGGAFGRVVAPSLAFGEQSHRVLPWTPDKSAADSWSQVEPT
jgi:hypothetical protein